jgi:hypothetical protein
MDRAANKAGGDPDFVLVGGHPSLNLVATLGRRHATPVERIPNAAALGRWLVAAGLLPSTPAVSKAHLKQAHQLREAISEDLTGRRARDETTHMNSPLRH